MEVKSDSEVAQSCPTLRDPWTAAYQAPLSMGFSRQEYWSGVPSPSPMENSIEVPQKTKKIELLYDPAIPLQDIHRDKTIIQKDTCIPMFIAALYKIAKTWK